MSIVIFIACDDCFLFCFLIPGDCVITSKKKKELMEERARDPNVIIYLFVSMKNLNRMYSCSKE